MEVQKAVEEYLGTLGYLGARTRRNYEIHLRTFEAWTQQQNSQREKNVTLETVNDRVVNAFVEHLKLHHHSNVPGQPMSTHTLASYVRTIKTFLHWCLEDEIYGECLKESQVRKIKMPRREEFVKETFTDGQLEKMRTACDQEMSEHLKLRARCILALLLSTGIRANELCTLKIQDVHLDPRDPYIKVHGKGNRWREVPLIALDLNDVTSTPHIDQYARDLLASYKQTYRAKAPTSAPFFVSRTYVDPIHIDGLARILDRLQHQAGITEISCNPHRFRHTFAARFAVVIGDIYLLSKMMGHSSVSITEHYLKSISGTGARLALFRKLKGEG